MAETETGWTKEFPSLRYGSWFWLRDAPDAEPRLTQLCGGYNFYEPMGIVGSNTEYLGPVLPSDFEQLTRLREAATLLAIPYEALLLDAESRKWIAPDVWAAIEKAVATLREALAQRRTGEQS